MNSLAIAIALLGLVASSYALDCYVCASDDSTCNDQYAMPADHKTTCTDGVDDGCSKAKSKGKVLGIEATTVIRSCGKSYDNSICSQADHTKVSLFGVKSEAWQCSCDEDSCNSSTNIAVALPLLLACVAKMLL